MLKQLRIKFVAVIMLAATVLSVFFLCLLYYSTAYALEANHIEIMRSVAGPKPPDSFSPEDGDSSNRLHYFKLMKTAQGELVVTENTGFDLSDTNFLEELYDTAARSTEKNGELKAYALRYLETADPHSHGYVFADISDEYTTLKNLKNSCILIGFMCLFILGIVSNYLSRILMHPVEQAWNQQKQFVADVSHELKTPLTVITANVEMLASPDYDNRQKAELVTNISSSTERMRALVEDMLDLARLDSSSIKETFCSLNYSALVEQSLLPFEPMFFESGRFLASEIDPDIHLNGSSPHLSQVTDILLDNALKYSDEGTVVHLTLHRQSNHALLCVESIGTPIKQEDLENIFLRFYTADKSRSGSSYGLGLSIAHAIILEHRGKIWAESTEASNKFFVRLPL